MSSARHIVPGLIVAATIQGCTEPAFEFRGYSDLSSCTEAIDAELAAGGSWQGTFDSEDIENPGVITEIDSMLFDQRVRIDVYCDDRGLLGSVHYIAEETEPRATGAIWARFSDELSTLFGEPTEILTDEARSRRWICHSPAPVLLEEWMLPPEDEDQADEDTPPEQRPHELYLAIVPDAAVCQDSI